MAATSKWNTSSLLWRDFTLKLQNAPQVEPEITTNQANRQKDAYLYLHNHFFFGLFACNISTAFQMHLRSIWLTHLFCAEDNSSSWSMNWLVTCILTPMLWEVINPVSSILPTRTLYTTKGNSALDLSLKRSSMWFNTRVYASVYASVRGA